ncbi:uncharacterized protein LOC134854357 [Symsagittifera roscoffensis]|uniref:uncharacterized protein LOC134854357 n=1 Tax=Symsagittifera roscoffensis TaxID=84072 RepID=UPI00307B7A81
MDLLLLSDGSAYHYVLINDLTKLVNFIRKRAPRDRNEICRNCFHTCTSNDILRRHQEICNRQDGIEITMPGPDNDRHVFKNFGARSFVPRIVYFDLESLIVPVAGPEPDNEKSNTHLIEKNQNCGYAFAAVEFGNPEVVKFELKRGPDSIEHLLLSLETLAKEVYIEKRRHYAFTRQRETRKEDTSECWICELPFAWDEEKVLDHCHYTNKFLGWVHNTCNINRKTNNFIPVVAHNLANYDLHCIIRALNKSNPHNVFSVIPSTEEKFISMTISVWIKTFYDKSGKIINVYENLRFIDSHKFMQFSLSTLVNNLPPDNFSLLENFFKAKLHSMEKIDLLKRKGFYPYSYIDSFKKFNEPRLPARTLWTNSLAGGEVSVDRSEFNHAIMVFTKFGCNSIGDYHDLYLSTDVLLLASVFEVFRPCAMKHMESIARTIIPQVTWRGMCSLKSAERIFDC